MKTHEMAFGMGFFWFVLLPSPAPAIFYAQNQLKNRYVSGA